MPSVLYASAVREAHDGFTLSMTARHTLNIGEEGPKVYNAKGRIPNIDILLRGDLVLCLCGIANGRPVPSSGVKSSAPAKRLHAYLSANASALGISTVSELYVDDDEVTKVNLSPSAPYEPEAGYPAAYLSTVAVTFVFYTKDTAPDGDIFTEQVFLPFGAALDRLVDKFATLHLARRYPLIFGPLRRKLQAERSYCLPISNSVVRISERSPNAHFRAEVTRLLARLDRKLSKEAQSLSSAYCQHAEIDEDEVRLSPSAALDADVKGTIPCTLSRILRSHVRSPRFKGTGSTAKRADESELPDDFPFVEIDDRSVAMPPLPKAFQAIPWDDLPLGLSGSTLDGTSPGCPAMDASTLPSANGRSLLAILDDVSDSDNVDRAILDNPLGDGTASDSDGNWELGDVDTPCESDCLYEGTSEDEPSSPICSRDSSQSDTLDTPSQSQRDTFADELVLRDDPMDLWTDSCQFSPTALDIPTKISELYLGNEDLLDSDDDLPVNDGERCPIPRSADAADIFETLFDPDDLPPLPTHSNQLTPELRWILYGDDDDELLPIATEDEDGCFDGDGDLLMDEDAAHFIL